MRYLIIMLGIAKGNESEVIEIATGKYEFTGKVIKDFLKIVKHGEGTRRN